MTEAREALQELVNTKGWQLFVRHAISEFQGEGYRVKMGVALQDPDNTKARVVHQTALEILRLLQWPNDRLKDLEGVSE